MDQEKKPAGMLAKFKTGYSADRIERVEVLRETAACVYLPARLVPGSPKAERREAKLGELAQYHDTWAGAHAFLVRRAEEKVQSAQLQLERVKGRLGNVKGLKPPQEGA